jgi:DNA-binding MarR family transcriptional regulator
MAATREPLAVGAALVRLTTAVGERVLETRATSGLSATQLQVLRLAADGATMGTLVGILGTPKSTMTSVVDQLERMGLASRGADSGDRRRQLVRSTAAGAEQLRDFDHAVAGRVGELVANLSSARALELRALLGKLPDATVPLPLSGPR